MEEKIIGIFICTLLIFTSIYPVTAKTNINIDNGQENKLELKEGWGLQWSHAYGGYGHSQHAQPIGDIDEDGINEVILGGYGSLGARIMFYNDVTQTYEQEYFWNYPGGAYDGVPSGVCIVDLDNDGELEFAASFEYGGKNGIFAYEWDGTTLTELDYYTGVGYGFAFDVYACDYDDDGAMEVLIANAPNMGGGTYHVTALGWKNDNFVTEATWACPGGADKECPEVWSGDVDNDGLTEVIADVSNGQTSTAGTWALNWNDSTDEWEGVVVCSNYPGSTVYGDSVGDMDDDGTPEIGIGSYGGTPAGWLFEWDGAAYQQVWHQEYPGQQPVIESTAIGDADNDGINEFCLGTGFIHIIQWDGKAYVEEATFTDPTGMLAGMNVGDCDSDGLNELKACEILSGTGSEFIYKYYDETPPVTTCELSGEMEDDSYISDVTVYLNATDDHSSIDYTMYKIDTEQWQEYQNPFIVSETGTHTIKFYSVDASGTEEDDKTVTFTIKNPCCFEIVIPKGISIGLRAKVKELCNVSHTDIPWSFEITNGKLKAITPLNGAFDISGGKTKTIRSRLVIGFGRVHIKLTVDDCDILSRYAFVIGPIVIVI
jgi:hypothetical protein